MGGQDALRGFEYQFMRTLEYALAALEDSALGATGIHVESPPEIGEPGADLEVVDFTVLRGEEFLVVAQVKSGGANSTLSIAAALPILLRLITVPAAQYVVLTNRAPGKNLQALMEALSAEVSKPGELSSQILDLTAHAPTLRAQLSDLNDSDWERIARCRIGVDDRSMVEIRHKLREQVRKLRPRYCPDSSGWDAAGLVLGYLLSNIMAKAVDTDPVLTLDELRHLLAIDNATIASAVAGKSWAHIINAAPRLTDVARPDAIDRIAEVLEIPNRSPHVPICVLSGLSGIGKTSIAAAWAVDRMDDYCAIFWVDASDEAATSNSFRVIASWLDHREGAQYPDASVLDRVQAGLSNLRQPWLIVFDNAPSSQAIKAWLPRLGLGHALVTSTDPTSWHGPNAFRVSVSPMTSDQAIRLLRNRLSISGDLPSNVNGRLVELAQQLQNWPLALELASAYLADCHNGLGGAAEYHDLVMRSLDDEESVPLGYPRTLVGAVRLAINRMNKRAKSRNSAKVALAVLHYASFLPSRLIPLHLLMACVWLEPADALQLDYQGPLPYRGENPPIGEVYRDLVKDSLASPDHAVFYDGTGSNGPQSVGYAITVNEIVQRILRAELQKLNLVEPAFAKLAFFAQHWLVGLLETERLDLATAILGQCCHLSDFAIRQRLAGYTVALLWGNTAAALGSVDDWARAATYLRAEDIYLSRSQESGHVMTFITKAQLAIAITRSAHRPSEVVDEVAGLLRWISANLDSALALGPQEVGLQLINSSLLAIELAQECPYHEEIKELKRFFEARAGELQSENEKAVRAIDVSRINDFLRQGNHEQARDLAANLVDDPRYSFYRPTVLRLLVEAKIALSDWEDVESLVDDMLHLLERDELDYLNASNFVINTGIRCLGFNHALDGRALRILARLTEIADKFTDVRHDFRPGDEAKVYVFRAYLAAVHGRFADADNLLGLVNEEELELAERGKELGLLQHYRTLSRWMSTAKLVFATAEA